MTPINLTSHGHQISTDADKFGFLTPSNDLLHNPESLHQRMADDGYLFFRDILDHDVITAARQEIVDKLEAIGEIDVRFPRMEAIDSGVTRRNSLDVKALLQDLRTGPAYRALCHDGRVMAFFEQFLGGPVRAFDYLWLRTVHVGGATGCHYDIIYMGRGTQNLYTAWIPIGDVPLTDGALMILENSHKLIGLRESYGTKDVDRDKDVGWLSKNPVEVQEKFGGRWLTADFKKGDLLVFTMFTLHCSLDNRSPVNRIRLTSDSRYQLASEPLDERWVGADPIAHSK